MRQAGERAADGGGDDSATLDGVSVTLAFLAFRAVRMQAPDRCDRVVWGAALATVNFAYEYTNGSSAFQP